MVHGALLASKGMLGAAYVAGIEHHMADQHFMMDYMDTSSADLGLIGRNKSFCSHY
jgi:hypothetical protein